MGVTQNLLFRPRNRLLAALPPEDWARFAPLLKTVELPFRQTLQTPGEPITGGHFIESGFVSMIVKLEDGDGAEVGLIGREGMLGLPLVYGADRSDIEGMVQGPGTALWIASGALLEACD